MILSPSTHALQPRIGRWRLAYLQAIRLAADIAGEKEDLA